MPVYRIVYTDDDSFRPRTLTAEFPSRPAAEAAMAKHGHRIAHIAEMGLGESIADPVVVPMASGATSCAGTSFTRECRERLRASAPQPLLGLPIYDLAAVMVVIAGAAMASAALLLF
jgi:hypothetical protein